MILHHWQHNIRMYMFSDENFFSKIVLTYLYYFHMMYQSTSSSEYHFLFHFPQAFLLIDFIIVQLRFINFIIHHYSSTSSTIKLISLSLETWIFWQLPSCFEVSSFFLSFSRCCKFWLSCTLIIDKRHW